MQLQNSGRNNDICRHFIVIWSKFGFNRGLRTRVRDKAGERTRKG